MLLLTYFFHLSLPPPLHLITPICVSFLFTIPLQLSLSSESVAVIFVPVDFAIVDVDELRVEVTMVEEDVVGGLLEKRLEVDVKFIKINALTDFWKDRGGYFPNLHSMSP